MDRTCGACHKSLVGKRPSAKWCDERCKKRGQRGQVAAPPATENAAPSRDDGCPGSVEAATVAELEVAGRLDSVLGRVAIALARQIDRLPETGLTSLAKELRATLADATKGAAVEKSPLDELRQLRLDRVKGRG